MSTGRLALLGGSLALLMACAHRLPATDGSVPPVDRAYPSMPVAIAVQAPPPYPEEPPETSATSDRPRAFAKCAPCHTIVPGRNGIGPSLAGVFGRTAGRESTFRYSAELPASGIVWNAATLDRFLAKPGGMVPGTKMVFRGLDDPLARAEIIAFLQRH